MDSLSEHTTKDPNDIIEMLLGHGINPTAQRIGIASFLLAKPQHLSAEALLSGLRKTGSKVSKATVYNTLNLFASKGLIREVLIDPSRIFYDSNTSHHHHIYNMDTGELTDICGAELTVNNLPQLPEGQVIDDIDIVVRVKNVETER